MVVGIFLEARASSKGRSHLDHCLLILAQNSVICDKSGKSGMGRLPMVANQILYGAGVLNQYRVCIIPHKKSIEVAHAYTVKWQSSLPFICYICDILVTNYD